MTKTADYDWGPLEDIANRLHDRGASLDAVLAALRAAGAGPLHSLRVLHSALGLSHRDAKIAVFKSPVWGDIKPAHDQLEADIEAAYGSRSPDDIREH